MTDTEPVEPTPAPVAGIACPRCKGTVWRVWETRPAPGRLLRVRTCCGCKLRVRTREVIEAVCKPKPKLLEGGLALRAAEQPA